MEIEERVESLRREKRERDKRERLEAEERKLKEELHPNKFFKAVRWLKKEFIDP